MKSMRIIVVFLIIIISYSSQIIAQPIPDLADTIKLINSSFEGRPMQSALPMGWEDCGFQGESAPDQHPNGFWGVHTVPYHGKTYIGMVARQNGTWEKMTQRLEKPLVAGACYSFSIFLAMSDIYASGMNKKIITSQISTIRYSADIFNFTTPIILNIWGSTKKCNKKELLAQSIPIDHTDWKEYVFILKPKLTYEYILFEVMYQKDSDPYNGNILLDKASDLIPVVCK